MVRSISTTLKAAQDAVSVTPYIHLLFTSKDGVTTKDFSMDSAAYGNRILLIDHNEMPYDDYATIVLQNNTRDIPDMTGYWTEIGYGAKNASGVNEYVGDGTSEPGTARLWVKHQQTVSVGGKIYEFLELEGMWARLNETDLLFGDAPYYNESYTVDTIYTIIGTVLAELAMTLAALGTQDDSIINDFVPQFDVNATPYETAGGVIYRLIQMTKSYLRAMDDLEFEVRYPQSADAVDVTYYSNEVPYFYEYTERRNVLVPNHIYVAYGQDEGTGVWTGVTDIEDTDDIAKYQDVPAVYQAGAVTNEADADIRANAILTRIEAEMVLGTMLAPHDCRVELFDRIKMVDRRGL